MIMEMVNDAKVGKISAVSRPWASPTGPEQTVQDSDRRRDHTQKGNCRTGNLTVDTALQLGPLCTY